MFRIPSSDYLHQRRTGWGPVLGQRSKCLGLVVEVTSGQVAKNGLSSCGELRAISKKFVACFRCIMMMRNSCGFESHVRVDLG